MIVILLSIPIEETKEFQTCHGNVGTLFIIPETQSPYLSAGSAGHYWRG